MPRPDVRDERIPQILDAAVAVFSRDGIDGANMSKIAEGAGVSKATIYHYFSSKEEVIGALVKRILSLDRTAVDELRNGSGSVRERLIGYADRLSATIQENRELFLVTGEIQARAARVPALKWLASSFYREYLAVVESVIEQAVEREEVERDIDVRGTAIGYVAVIEGTMIVGQHVEGDPRESMIASVSAYLNGIIPT